MSRLELPLDAYFAHDRAAMNAHARAATRELHPRPESPLDHWLALSMMRQYRSASAGSWALLRRLARAHNPRA